MSFRARRPTSHRIMTQASQAAYLDMEDLPLGDEIALLKQVCVLIGMHVVREFREPPTV